MLKKLFKLGTLLLSVIFISSLAACNNNGGAQQQQSPTTETKQVLRVGMNGDLETYMYQQEELQDSTQSLGLTVGMAPYCWIQENSANGAVKIENSDKYMNGYDVRVAKKVAEGLGKELVVVNVAWEDLIDKVNSGEIDLIISGMSPIAERKEKIDFSDYYYNSGFSFAVRKDGDLAGATKLSDFKGKKLASMSNTVSYSLLDAVEGMKKIPYDNFTLCAEALNAGKIDAFLTENPRTKMMESKNPSFKAIEVTSELKVSKDESSIAIGMKKGSELKSKIDSIISSISQTERENLMNEVIQSSKIK